MNSFSVARDKGFTLVEMLMVIVLIAIMAALAIPQFIDFRVDAKNAATNAGLATMRTGINVQMSQMLIKCGVGPGTYPTIVQLAANSVVVPGGPCTVLMIPSVINWPFVFRFPDNPWSGVSVPVVGRRAVIQCVGNGCLRDGSVSCDGVSAWGPTIGGWCYNSTNGTIWANSNSNAEYQF